jgi:hypothetical protein
MGPIARHFRRGIAPRPFGPLAAISSTPSRGGAIQSSEPLNSSFHISDLNIPSFVDHNGTVYYQIHVVAFGTLEWMISHRYSEFYALYEKISYWLTCSSAAPFPQKIYSSWMISMTDEDLTARLLGLKVRLMSFLTQLIFEGMAQGNS